MVVPIGKDDEGLGGARAASCASCNATLASSQRYCLECGARRGPVPAEFAKWLSITRPVASSEEATTGGAAPDAEEGAAATALAEGAVFEDSTLAERFMPEPRSAAIATMALLAFGVVIGAATGPLAQSAGIAPIVVEMGSSPSTASTPEAEAEAPESIAEAPVESPQGTTSSISNEPGPEEIPQGGGGGKEKEPIEEEVLPPIQHVFMIVLGDHGYEEAFGAGSQSTYLSQTLPAKGELLSNYFAVTQGDLANEVALLSGQGPTPATAANCPEYKDVTPGTLSAEGQAEGDGCVYPAEVKTLPGQLVEAKKSWKAYVEGIGGGQAGQPTSCRHPALGGPDDAQAPLPGDPYETWRNPFVYFHSLVDNPECGERDVGLEQLEADLKVEKQTPAFSYIVPDACHDGSETPCEPSQPAGLAAAQPFLEKVVPEIEASAAYKKGGLIAITFAQAPQSGPNADAGACCATPEYPNLPPAPAIPASTGPVKETGGGGRVGMLLLSPFVEPGSVNESGYYNHFSMLLSIEEFFGLPAIGYAAGGGILPFDGSVFNLSS
jgi:phosphatidylinositol-3-phosphatase